MYKLARPLMRGFPIEIAAGVPYMIVNEWVNFHKRYKEVRKSIANRMVNDMLGGLMSFRGELIVGKPSDPTGFEASKLFLETAEIIHLFVFWVYDLRTTAPMNLKARLDLAQGFVNTCGPVVQFVDHELLQSQAELDAYKKTVIEENLFPGIVLREPYGTFGTEDEIIKAETPIDAQAAAN